MPFSGCIVERSLSTQSVHTKHTINQTRHTLCDSPHNTQYGDAMEERREGQHTYSLSLSLSIILSLLSRSRSLITTTTNSKCVIFIHIVSSLIKEVLQAVTVSSLCCLVKRCLLPHRTNTEKPKERFFCEKRKRKK